MWRAQGRLVGIAIAFATTIPSAGAFWLIHAANVEVATSHQEAETSAKTYTDHSDVAKERRCGPLAAADRYKCVIEEESAANQGRHDAYDLEAQQVSAVWTRYTGLAAILGTAFGVLGVTLVLLTFWENKRAADAAHDANRPWVECEEPTGIDMSFTADGIDISMDVGFINHGNSPATNTLVRAKLLVTPFGNPGIKGTIGPCGIESALDEWETEHRSRGRLVYPSKPEQGIATDTLPVSRIREAEAIGEAEDDMLGLCSFFLVIGVSYRFAGKTGRTVKSYVLTVKDHTNPLLPPYNVAENMTHIIHPSQVTLIDTLEGYAT
jgi:hypothetical protein